LPNYPRSASSLWRRLDTHRSKSSCFFDMQLTMRLPLPNSRFGIAKLPAEDQALPRLSKALAVVATLLLAMLAFSMSGGTASAHGGHNHSIFVAPTGASDAARTQEARAIPELAAASYRSDTLNGLRDPLPQGEGNTSDCCCGSVMCHAGIASTADVIGSPASAGARVAAAPSYGHPRHWASGLERPPRT
jgi:hypothetical protein